MAQMRLKDKNCLAVALCFKTNRRKCRRQVASPTGESDDYSESLESLWNRPKDPAFLNRIPFRAGNSPRERDEWSSNKDDAL